MRWDFLVNKIKRPREMHERDLYNIGHDRVCRFYRNDYLRGPVL